MSGQAVPSSTFWYKPPMTDLADEKVCEDEGLGDQAEGRHLRTQSIHRHWDVLRSIFRLRPNPSVPSKSQKIPFLT